MKRLLKVLIICVFLLPAVVSAYDYTEYFNRIVKDGKVYINGNKPRTNQELFAYVQYHGDEALNDPYVYVGYIDWTGAFDDEPAANEDGSYTINLYLVDSLSRNCPNHTCAEIGLNDVKVYFNEDSSKEYLNRINEIANSLKDKTFILDDLGFVNYISIVDPSNDPTTRFTQEYMAKGLLYSNDFLEQIGNNNISYYLENYAGDGDDYILRSFGSVVLKYNGYLQTSVDHVGLDLKYLMYVPSDTEDTPEAYIAVVKDRIKKYLGLDVEMEAYKRISEILKHDGDVIPDWSWDNYMDMLWDDTFENHYGGYTNKLDMVYRFKISDVWYYFLIEKNDERLKEPLFNVKDINTSIKISSNVGNVPLDTTFKAVYVKDGETYEDIKKRINGDFTTVDLSLYSPIKDQNITKLENGKFKVSIPVPANLEGKTIYVYYITSTGELEEHEATVKDGIASFETDHFSTYILAEKQTKNPKTGDNIRIYLSLLFIGLCGCYSFIKYLNKGIN